MADPTVEFLDRLKDPSRWEIRRGVPVFEPHTRAGTGPDGKPREIKVTAEDLPAIAAESNRLEAEKGVVGRLTDKHTMRPRADGKGLEPVTPVPTLYGFQKNYRVGVYGPHSKPCILADWFLFPEHAHVADRSPHRSVEYYHNLREIRGSAVMMTDPYLDMGMVVYGEGAAASYIYFVSSQMAGYGAMGARDASLPDAKDGKAGTDAGSGAGHEEHEEHEGKKKPEDFKPEEKELFEKMARYMRSCYGLHDDWPKEAPKKAEHEPDTKTSQEHADPAMQKPDEVQPMATDKVPEIYTRQLAELRTDYEAKFSQLQTALAAEKARNDGLALERDHEAAKHLLATGLVNYQLSPDEHKKELAKLVKMPAAERPERVKELRVIYADRQVPEGRLELYGGPVEGGEPNPADPFGKPWYHDAAMAYMHANPGTQYQKAIEHVQATAARK